MELKQLNPMNWFTKENRAQESIARSEGSSVGSYAITTVFQAFERLESVNRGTSMIVSGAASFDYDVKDKVTDGVVNGIRLKTLEKLINFEPNPYQSIQEFRTNIFMDFILEGNAFIYFDGRYMYHLPSSKVTIEPDEKTHIKCFRYMNEIVFRPDEVFYFSDVSRKSIYRADSRLASSLRTINTLYKMQQFQESFFENGAIPGLILETENTLSQQAKVRTINTWKQNYNPKGGARSPMIVDNGLKLKEMFHVSFQDLDFDNSITRHDYKILTALGVPQVLIDGGNNANISPNLRLFYLETILPIVNKYTSAMERFFGFDISPIQANVSALQPDMKDVAAYHSSLVNGGIEKPNEARAELRLPAVEGQDMDKIRIPANIAGSATNPDTGGAPKKDKPAE
jgi:HK97 family phage portal protein